MISGALSNIGISEFLIQFEFDSGDSVAAYDVIVFKDADGETQSRIDARSIGEIVIPAGNYLGRTIVGIDVNSGIYSLCFNGGYKIELVRTQSSHEIGLVSTGENVEEIF